MKNVRLILAIVVAVILSGCGSAREKREAEAEALVKKDLDLFRTFFFEGANPRELPTVRLSKAPVDMRVFEDHYVRLSTTRDTQKAILPEYELNELDLILRSMERYR